MDFRLLLTAQTGISYGDGLGTVTPHSGEQRTLRQPFGSNPGERDRYIY